MHARARARFRPGIALCVLLALCLRVRAQENGGGSSLTGLAEATRVLRETDAAPHDPRGVLAALLGFHATLGAGAEDAMHAWMTDVFQSKWEHRPCTDDHDHTGALPSNDPLFRSGMVPPAGLQLANMLELLGSNRNAAANLDHLIMVKSRDGKSVEQTAADLMEMCDDVPASARGLEESGQTLVLYLERLPACLYSAAASTVGAEGSAPHPASAALLHLVEEVKAVTGLLASLHVYVSRMEGAQALVLHADPHDVLAVQINGTKHWEVCVPAMSDVDEAEGLSGAQLAGLHELRVRERLADAKVRIASDTFSRLQQQAAQHDSVSPFEDPANAHEGTRLRVVGKPSLSLKLPPAQKAYAQGTLDRGNMQCTNFTMLPGDRLYLPWGTLHRAWTGTGGSTHLTVGLTHQGSTFGDVILAGLSAASGTSPYSFYSHGAPGKGRVRTPQEPGQCGGAPCQTRLDTLAVLALQHNDDSNGPRALLGSSVLLAQPLPSWQTKPLLEHLAVLSAASGEHQQAIRDAFVTETAMYTRFVEIVVDAFAPQLMEVAAMQGEHVSQDDLLDFLGQVSSVDHFVHGLARVQQVPYYTRDDTACETGS